MKRTDITELFPEATKEQIDRLMDLNGADLNAARSDVQSLKDQIEALKTAQDGAAASAAGLQAANDEIAQLKTQLDGMRNAEKIRGIREKVSGEKKVPVHLLTADTEAACVKQADAILSFAQSQSYPNLPDGGEPSTPPSNATRDKFAAWAKENL